MDSSNGIDFVVESDREEEVSVEISLLENVVGIDLIHPITPTRKSKASTK